MPPAFPALPPQQVVNLEAQLNNQEAHYKGRLAELEAQRSGSQSTSAASVREGANLAAQLEAAAAERDMFRKQVGQGCV